MARRTWIPLCVLLLSTSGIVAAGPKKGAGKVSSVRVAILPVQVKDLPTELAKTIGVTLVSELGDLGIFEVVSGKEASAAIDKLRKKKVYTTDCASKRRCIREVGRTLKVKVLYHLFLSKATAGVSLSMRTFDVASGTEVRQETGTASRADEEEIDRATRWLARKVSGPMITTMVKGKGRLQVDCNEADAELIINEKSFGKRTNKGFKVSAGVFDVVVRKPGFLPFQDVVVVKPDQEKVVTAKLKSEKSEADELAEAVPEPGSGTGSVSGGKPPAAGGGEKKPDMPAWARFEGDKPPPAAGGGSGTAGGGSGTAGGGSGTAGGGSGTAGASKPYLPPTRKPDPVVHEEPEDGQTAFYETWWFWTLVGVGVAGAAVGVAVPLTMTGGGDAGTGSAVLSWQ